MSHEAWITLLLLVAMLAAMVRGRSPDLVLLAGTVALLAFGVLTPEEALAGFSNEGMITVGVLFVVAAGIRETGGLDAILRVVLGAPKRVGSAQLRMMVPVSALSAFLNNTPLVAIMLPIVTDWARRVNIAPSKLLMPLSFATILGGTCTLIGTSTNLVVSGLAKARTPPLTFGLFDLAPLGIPVLIAGLAYMLIASRWLLPSTKSPLSESDNARQFMVAMRVEPGSAVVGRTVEQAGLRHLPGLFLVEIQRAGHVIPAVGPETRLEPDDQLLFAGIVESVVDLRKVRGLVPATDQLSKIIAPRPERRLVEVVVAARSALAGMSIRETKFRTTYDAAVIAVHRGGERIAAKVGDIVLKPGDVLLVEAAPSFTNRYRNDQSFALVREVEGSAAPHHEKAWLATGITVAMVLTTAFGIAPLIIAALVAAALMLFSGCMTVARAREAVEPRVLLAIASAFAVGAAMEKTGLAGSLADLLVGVASPFGRIGVISGVYVATALLTNLITNNSAAALMFPLCAASAEAAGIEHKPMLLVMMMAASASFATPIGYQTNLMVYGPGRYRFMDFVRFGGPLQVITAVVTIAVASALWL